MDNFVWNDRFNIGVDEVDEQHRLFLDYVNDCYNAACRDDRTTVTDATIYDLKVYAATHFRFEEALMREKGYPGLEQHAVEHAYFEGQVAKLEKAHAEDGRKKTVANILPLLKDWFLEHILEHDRKFAAYLR